MSRPDQKIIDRIRKMLALANNNSNPNEAATAAAMAEKLMRRHQLAHADVVLKDIEESGVETVDIGRETVRTPKWHTPLFVGCAELNECTVVTTRHSGHSWQTFYGCGGDAQVAAEMTKYLIGEVNRLSKRYGGSKNEFRQGAAMTLYQRLQEMSAERRAEMAQAATSKELVVVKSALIQRAVPSTRREATTMKPRDADAYQAGKDAGSRVSLNPQLGSHGQQEVLA